MRIVVSASLRMSSGLSFFGQVMTRSGVLPAARIVSAWALAYFSKYGTRFFDVAAVECP